MPECINPLWPCALTGAAACLAGFRDVGVIIHGSSGCYFYPATVLHAPLHCTCLNEEDIIFGTEQALLRTVEALEGRYERLAVLCTCVPTITGEDFGKVLKGRDILVMESPGFIGEYEAGYKAAAQLLGLKEDSSGKVNVDGLSLMDPFSRGDGIEVERMLSLAGIRVGARFFDGDLSISSPIAPFTVTTNPDLASGIGRLLGSLFGLPGIPGVLKEIDRSVGVEGERLETEIRDAEERISAACDKYLRRFEPPDVALFGQFSRMAALAEMLDEYLDATILGIGSRNPPGPSPYRSFQAREISSVETMFSEQVPDLVLGSSFEQSLSPESAFVGVTPPLRGEVRLHSRPMAGIQGSLAFMESVLNACINRQKG